MTIERRDVGGLTFEENNSDKREGIKKQTGLPVLQPRTAFKSSNPVRDVHIPGR